MTNTENITIVGCGYIGKQLALRLQDKDHAVNGIVSTETSRAECTDKGIACEIIDLDQPLADINLYGQRLVYLAPPPRSGKTDTRMTHFLQAIESSPPEKFVLISTTGVYGDCRGEWIDETRPLNPSADRAFRRADAEQQVQRYCKAHDIPLVILRVAGIYGPGKIPLARISSGQPIVNAQDSPFTNRIHAHDLVTICEKSLLDMAITGIFNVTDGHPGTMYEYFTGIARTFDLPEPPAISLEQAQHQLSEGMLSYMAESRRIRNDKLLHAFDMELQYPSLSQGLESLRG